MVFGRSIGPGDDVEAWCTRCRMNLNHRIIAMVGGDIKRVHCLTCGSDHKYYPPKGDGASEKAPKTVRVAASGKGKETGRKAAARAGSEWSTVMRDMPPDLTPRPYRVAESFEAGEYISHPSFGTGRVLERTGAEKIDVIFEEGRKVLICNRPPS